MTTRSELTAFEADPESLASDAERAAFVSQAGRSTDSQHLTHVTDDLVYDRTFWLAYLSNLLTTIANGMMVRYADFIDVIGGDERQLGLIVGCGMIGSIAIRLAQGSAVDRYGAGRVWLWSLATYSLSLLLHLSLSTAYGPGVFVVRAMMQASLAGIFGSSITFTALRVRPGRMAEVVGSLGTSGFIGLMLGPVISDWLGSGDRTPQQFVPLMFCGGIALTVCSLVATWLATRHAVVPVRTHRPALLQVVKTYHPLMISIAAVMMGAGFAIPVTFLRPFASEISLSHVWPYFAVYSATGFAARIASRSMFERLGNRPVIAVGLMLLSLSFVCYLPVSRTWHLFVPAAIAGAAHALLFPSIMSAGTGAFPRHCLGVATSFILAMFDMGTLISAPIAGAFLRSARQYTDNAYPWMFAGTAVVFILVTIVFCTSQAAHQVASNDAAEEPESGSQASGDKPRFS